MTRLLLCLLLFMGFGTCSAHAQDKSDTQQPASVEPVPLNPQKTVLLDKANNKLLLKTQVCLREGVLEMFVCPKQTKEHESILSLDSAAYVVHGGLLALGAEPGAGVRFQPEYMPPTGQKIEIYVNWKDENGKPHRMKAQQWIRHATHRYFEAPLDQVPEGLSLGKGDDSLRYDEMNSLLLWFGTMSKDQRKIFLEMSSDEDFQKAVKSLYEQSQPRQMEASFVFAGSGFSKLPNGENVYLAEAGSLICVANFGDAMIDVNMQSTSSNDLGLLFEPWTDRIPPLKTPVTVELIPVEE